MPTSSPESLFGLRLAQARKIAKFSLRALSGALDGEPSHAMLSRYERGEAMPGTALIARLAEALSVNPDFFFRRTQIKFSELSFRKRVRLSATERRAIEEKARDFFARYQEIEEIVGDHIRYQVPDFSEISPIENEADIEQCTMALRQQWDLGDSPLPNLHQLLESNGIKVHEVRTEDQLFDGFSGELINEDGSSSPMIVIAKWLDDNLPRKRMTIAHELGHVILPLSEGLAEKDEENLVKPFAGSLLLPEEPFRRMFGEDREAISLGELIDLKAYWGVSIWGIMHRAQNLGLIPGATYKRFCIQANKMRWRSQGEPDDGNYKGEESHGRFRSLVLRAVSEGLISSSKGAALLNKSLAEFRDEFQETFA